MYNYYGYGGASGISTVMVIFGILGLIGGIVLVLTFLSKKNEGKFTGFLKYLYEFLNFEKLWFMNLAKILYITIASVCFLGGFICLFISFATGISLIIAGVVFRLSVEAIIILMKIGQNVSTINKKLGSDNSTEEEK